MSELTREGHVPVWVIQVDDPAAEAERMAANHGADVAANLAAAERIVRDRVEAGRRALGGGPADDDVLARAGAIRSAAATVQAPLTDADAEELRHLAADIGRAARIRQQTETRAHEVLHAKVVASAGVAIHPEAVIEAGRAVQEAEAALAAAESALQARRAGVDGADVDEAPHGPDDPLLHPPHDDFDEASLERRRGRRRALVVFVVCVAIGGALVAAGLPLIGLGGFALFGLLAAALVVLRSNDRAEDLEEPEGKSRLAAVDRVLQTTETMRAIADIEHDEAARARAAAAERLLHILEADRDVAEEKLRVARNRWVQLAGPGADHRDPEAVARAHDPQLALDGRVADANPTVRTVAAFHRKALARWRIMWAGLGREEPPEPDDIEAVLDDLLDEWRTAQDDLRRLEQAELRVAAAAQARRPIVLVEPRSWVAADRLAQLLSSVPADGEVFVVERADD